MIGNIYRVYCRPNNAQNWEEYHLMPLVEFSVMEYKGIKGQVDAVKCLVLETGDYHEMYADVLKGEGKQVG